MVFSHKKSAGFTLIELMITISIFVFMTALVMARYNDYYSGTIFKNLAYDIAITIREAQSYGISVKVRTDSFQKAYGVHFPGGAKPTEFYLKSFELGATNIATALDEKTFKLKHGAVFSSFQVSSSGNENEYTPASDLVIIFQRPNPEAVICANVGGGGQNCTAYKYAKINLQAVNGASMTVKVNTSGQIAITDN